MRTVSRTALVFATLLTALSARPVQAQIGGFIKKKAAEVAKGKATEEPMTSSWKNDACGPITPEKLKDLLRGLEVEGAARSEYDAAAAKAEATRADTEAKVKACRDAENGGATFQKMMIDGFSGSNPPSTAAAVQAQMAKNKASFEEFLDKKCGKSPGPPTDNARDVYRKAHADGAKAAGMSEPCYDWLADPVIAFCKLPKDQQQTAIEKGLRANARQWLFTTDEAKAIQPYCAELMPALKKAGSTIVP